jgi:hypothetical protein
LALVKLKTSSNLEDKEMSRITSPIDVTVEYITAPKDGNYGPYCGVKFRATDGQEIWKNYGVDSDELGSLMKGSQVQLIPIEKDGKISHQIVLPCAPSAATVPASKPRTQTAPIVNGNQHKPESSGTLVQKADDLARFYRLCYDLAMREMGGEVPADAAIPIATTIFQQALSQ